MREAYHKDLEKLEEDLMAMAKAGGRAVLKSIDALESRDLEASQAIVDEDKFINERRFKIEEQAMLLLATQQPMASDLRTLAAILNVITDLERIGDYAAGNAKVSLMIGDRELIRPVVDMREMAKLGCSMLERCMEAFKNRDAETARKICSEDDKVDEIYDRIYKDLVLMMVESPGIIQRATYMMWASHNLERVADRVTNIAERVVFMVTGKMEEMGSSKY